MPKNYYWRIDKNGNKVKDKIPAVKGDTSKYRKVVLPGLKEADVPVDIGVVLYENGTVDKWIEKRRKLSNRKRYI